MWKAVVFIDCLLAKTFSRWTQSTIAGTITARIVSMATAPGRICPRLESFEIFISVHDPDLLDRELEHLAAAELDRFAHRDRDADDRDVVGVRIREGDVDQVRAHGGRRVVDDLHELAALLPE